MNALNSIIWYANQFLNNVGFIQSRLDPIFIPSAPQNLIPQIENNENIILNAEELKQSLKRTGKFNVFTYLNHIHSDRNYNNSLTYKSLDGSRYATNRKTRYYITRNLKNKDNEDLSAIDISQLHKNFQELPESDKILSEYNTYLRFIKWQRYGIDINNEFSGGGLYRLIITDYPIKFNDQIIYVDIPESTE